MKAKAARANTRLDQLKLLRGALALQVDKIETELSVDESNERIVKIFTESILERRPRRSKPWFDASCYRALSDFRRITSTAAYDDEAASEIPGRRARDRALLRQKRTELILRRQAELLERAASEPFVWLRRSFARTSCPIPSETLKDHFARMFNSENLVSAHAPLHHFASSCDDQWEHDPLNEAWTIAEVVDSIGKLPKRKASGPDGTLNEHLS